MAFKSKQKIITKLGKVRGELVDLAIELKLTGETRQSFSATVDWLTKIIRQINKKES